MYTLDKLAHEVCQLLELIDKGRGNSEHVIGISKTGARMVRLSLRAEVVDAGANPLQTHGTVHPSSSNSDGAKADGEP